MKIHLAQLVVENDLAVNFAKIRRVMAGVQADEWVVFPEASLSGYFPDDPAYTPPPENRTDIPEKYRLPYTSPLSAEVVAGRDNTVDFELAD